MKKIISLCLALLLIFPSSLIGYAENNSKSSNDPNFYISGLNQSIVYVDGEKINMTGSNNVFETYIEDLHEDSVIAIKATDSDNKSGIYAGLKVTYKINDQWYSTNGNWKVFVPIKGSSGPPNIAGEKWNKVEYKGDYNWSNATVVDEYNTQITTPSAIELDWDDSHWIWSSKYGMDNGGLDSPVYFRNTLYIEPEPETFTVTFEDFDNTELKVETVASGDNATPPADPSRSGYTFDGWNGDYMNVTSNRVITATYKVITTTGGGGTTRTTSSVNAVTDNFTILENEILEIEISELMENDTNADSFDSVQDGVNGTVSLDGTTVTFTPDQDFSGRAYFYYTISDGNDEDNGLVIITIEDLVEINPSDTPLGNGNPDAFIVIEPEIVPLGIIDFSMPYIMGYPDITFRAEREVTRAEMAAIFARILGLDLSNPGEPMYEDINTDAWYYNYVQSVSRVGLFSGYSDKLFKPNQPVTHAEIASAFSNYWELRGIEIDSDGNYYSDISGHWAEKMINRLYNSGISVGYTNGTFKPDAFTTRVELVVLVNRSLNRPEEFKDIPSFSDVLKSYWGFGAIEAANGYQEPESAQLSE